jgi:hypothetical protein
MDDGLLDRLARREVGEADLRRIEEHLGSCPVCARKASDRASAALARLRDHFLFDAPAALEHPGRDELARYARRALDLAANEIVETHLDECDECARVIAEIRMRRRGATRRVWLTAAAAAIVIALIAVLMVQRSAAPPTVVPPVVKRQPAEERAQPRAPESVQVAEAYADPEWNALVRTATETGRLPLPHDLDTLRGDEDVVRGSGAEAGRVQPAGKVVGVVRPEFSWPSRDGATYTVFVFDVDREIARSAPLSTTRWTVPVDLPRGRTLTWQVEAVHGENIETIPRPPAPPARFRIITEDDQRDLARARELHAGDDLLLGVLYARAGMLDEAKASLQRAAKDDLVARRLLESISNG